MKNVFDDRGFENDQDINMQTVVRELFSIGRDGSKEDSTKVSALKALADILQKGNPLDPEKSIDEQIMELSEILTIHHLLGVLPKFKGSLDLIENRIKQIKEGKLK